MDSFDQLMKLAHEAKESYENFISKDLKVTVEEAFLNYYKSRQICKDIQDKMAKIEKRQDGGTYGYDMCVYYMALLTEYQYAALLVFTAKFGETSKQLAEKQAEEKQKESLKQLIKQVIKEAREEKKSESIQVKKRKKSLQ